MPEGELGQIPVKVLAAYVVVGAVDRPLSWEK